MHDHLTEQKEVVVDEERERDYGHFVKKDSGLTRFDEDGGGGACRVLRSSYCRTVYTVGRERESKRAKENFKEKKVGGGGVGEGEEKTQ